MARLSTAAMRVYRYTNRVAASQLLTFPNLLSLYSRNIDAARIRARARNIRSSAALDARRAKANRARETTLRRGRHYPSWTSA